jgi:hypothetical protein
MTKLFSRIEFKIKFIHRVKIAKLKAAKHFLMHFFAACYQNAYQY